MTTLKDKLSHLSYTQACKLLGEKVNSLFWKAENGMLTCMNRSSSTTSGSVSISAALKSSASAIAAAVWYWAVPNSVRTSMKATIFLHLQLRAGIARLPLD